MKRSVKLMFALCLIAVLCFSLTIYAAPQANLRFVWWGGESRHKATMDAIELYMKENPGVKINGEYGGFSGYQQKLLTQLAGGMAPDIIQIDQPWLADMMSQGDLFVDLYKQKEIQLSGFDKKFLKSQCEWNGKLAGLPTGVSGLIYFANTDFLAKHKIAPTIKWDWDKLLEVGTRVHKENKDHYLLTMDLTHLEYMIKMYVKQNTGIQQWVNDDFTPGFDKASLTKAFAYYQKLLQTGTIPPLEDTILFTGKTEQNPKWGNGQIGLAENWVSASPLFTLDGKLKLAVMAPPVMSGSKNSGIIVRPAQMIVINKKSSNVKEAAKFVNWFFNNSKAAMLLKTERGIPPTQSALKALQNANQIEANMVKGINLSMKAAGTPENALTTNKELNTIFDDYIQKVGFKRLTPEDAADRMLKDFKAKLAELKNQK